MLSCGDSPYFSFRATRWFWGALLLIAALLKAQQLLTEQSGSDSATLFWLGVAGGELLLALWLVSGKWPALSLRIGLICFACFAAVSLWKISQGIENCGCFGKLNTSPKLSYWIDWLALALGVWSLGTERAASSVGHLRRSKLLFPALLLLAIAFYYTGLSLARNSDTNPGRWVGRPWPPTGTVSAPSALSEGSWVVILYRSSCGHCQAAAAEYAELARVWQSQNRKIRVALLDADPESGIEKPWSRLGLLEGALEQPGLYRADPVVIVLVAGRIVAVQEGWGSIDWDSPPYSKCQIRAEEMPFPLTPFPISAATSPYFFAIMVTSSTPPSTRLY